MRLKCIKLSGFKSFVDPTTVNFPSDLCAVVGPNGCGKSNIIDAVRWVMGESSAKNLRGEQMTDVIFNGSSSRKPIGQASVELLFDNEDHGLKGEYANFAEVSIKRKVDRNAQSTYSLNGTKCRRRDITDIFLGTGLGPKSYSIIEQGMISRLIESKPEDLRIFIEEAAGISKYKERRKETESRIKRTRDNLERLTDIRDELQKQLAHLKRQSVAAEKYGEYKELERGTQANLNALRWRKLDAELKQQQEITNSLELKIEETIAQQRSIDAKVEKHLADNAEFTDALGEVQARFYGLGNEIARLEQSIEHHLERAEQTKQDLQETEEVWEQTREEMDVDLQQVIRLDEERESIEPQLADARQEVVKSGAELEQADEVLQQWQQAWDKFSQQAEEPRQVAEVEQARIQQLESIVERALERKNRLTQELESLQEDKGEHEETNSLSGEIALLENSLDQLQVENKKLVAGLETLREQDQRFNAELDNRRSELQTGKGRLASLEALQQAALGRDNSGINKWLDDKGLKNSKRLGESISVEAGWEAAVEVVLGDSLQSICVDSIADLESLLTGLPRGMLSLLETSTAGGEQASPNKGAQLLSEKVSADWQVGEMFSGIFACEDLPMALALRPGLAIHESVVTPQGVWLGKHWIRAQGQTDKDSGILERRGQISEIFIKIKKLNGRVSVLIDKQSECRLEISNSESRREELQHQLAEKNAEFSELKSQLSARLATVEQTELQRERTNHDLNELLNQLEIEKENTASARQRLQTAIDAMEQDVNQREKLEQQRRECREKFDRKKEVSGKSKETAHQLELRHQFVTAQLKSTRESMDRMASQVQRSKERIETLVSQLENSDKPLKQMREDLEGLLGQRLVVEKELSAAKARVDENEHTIRSLEHRRTEIERNLGEVREEMMQYRIKSEGASVRRGGLLEQLNEANFKLEEVLAGLPEELDEATCETELEKISNRIQRLGPINLAAIDEYKQKSERKDYLDKQNEDLEKALVTLRNAIRKIDKETRVRFKDTFDKINSGLQKLFPKVFGGGHAYLDMTGDDLLDTGVAIMARPPGKRNSTIHLLSGGEKAMTAIALIFSIFQLNPSPFCMLDEVDAPLDDANVGRYASLVSEMSSNVQFIFITHNKITMEIAKQLLGVTMHEAGVSRLVAVDIEEAVELAAM
ncbi:MAG: chromosome segregation protein SMC [Gammaproteobacteria bacterium]|nr:chromosome segregation protein SMC [Gammaproteobacteria bacterium]